ncbi:cholinesterase-like [Ptychodera flava]|uniref:cholinesterase-like n=1 Tax=Ptychodera flava TaxID=63121 RepID=UPI00396AB02A
MAVLNIIRLVFISGIVLALSISTKAYSVDYVNYTYVTAETTDGTIRGMRTLQTDGKYMDVYLGIPFAAPPIGDLRFAPPESPTPWSNVRDAFSFKSSCPMPGSLNGDEDCLYLNIYTPFASNDKDTVLPVMLWIHGGCFVYGTSEEYDGSILAQNDVIIVVANYRLGALGFLSTDDQVAAGNWGLLDNIMALQWIQKNIGNFGGDPNRVTAFGQSAGGVSASLLLFSPLAAGLLNGVIAMSGSATAPWAIFRPPYKASDAARELAQSLSCPTDSSEDIILCLRTKTWNELVNTGVTYPYDYCEWTPNVDGYFIQDDPMHLLQNGDFLKVPFIIGQTRDESYYGSRRMTRTTFENSLQSFLSAPLYEESGNKDALYDALIYEYTEPTDPDNSEEIRNQYVQLNTDYGHTAPNDYHGTCHSLEQNDTYRYAFHYLSQFNAEPEWVGVSHSYDLYFLFGTPFLHSNRTCPWGCDGGNWYKDQPGWSERDREISEFTMKLFTNLPKYGNPTPQDLNGTIWEPFNDVTDAYLEINDVLTVKYDYRARRTLFWNDYFAKILQREPPPSIVMTPPPANCPAPNSAISQDARIFKIVAVITVSLVQMCLHQY